MHWIDYSIVGVYLAILIAISYYFQRLATRNTNSFFLGDNNLPWWALGASGMASNLDVSGTMIIAAMVYALGVQGIYIGIRGDVVLILAFLMIFTGKWNRRSNVMTVAEWMEFRFGTGREGQLARLLSAISALVFTVWALSYFNTGSGIFFKEMLGIDPFYGMLIMISISLLYSVLSGLYGVVYTEVFQGVLILITIIYVVIRVMVTYTLPETFMVSVPVEGGGFKQIETTLSSWTQMLPSWSLNLPAGPYAQYNILGLATLYYLFRTVLDGASGAGGYIAQRFYAAKNEREVGLLSLFWVFLLAFRWPFVISIAILGIFWGIEGNVIENPEAVLPVVMMNLFPVGMKGLVVAGLMAAAMSTFVALVNSGAAYWVNDLYVRFMNPQATDKTQILHSRGASVVVVILGLATTYLFTSLNDVWDWLLMGFGVGMIIPGVFRWYWWRFNGYGYAAGVVTGLLFSTGQRLFEFQLDAFTTFFLTASITTIACILATLLTPPTEMDTLVNFYRKTRPFGFWKPVKAIVAPEEVASIRTENRKDLIATPFAMGWQMSLFIMMMVLPTKQWTQFGIAFLVFVFFSAGLYLTWFRNLSKKSTLT
ncbi:MAG: sodium:solute symporter [Rhodothermia bacterium]|nr:sodium:solute symporter [Rhodothermia bacterium]